MSHFFAYLAKMKFIKRWGLMRNSYVENIQEHSLDVAMIAHGLAMIKNTLFDGQVNPERVMALALYHDVSEVITGDLATPIKTFNPAIKTAFHEIERVANKRLFDMIPEALRADYAPFLLPQDEDAAGWELVKAADRISAYLKCVEELNTGNQAFAKALHTTETKIEELYLRNTWGGTLSGRRHKPSSSTWDIFHSYIGQSLC